MMMKKADTTMPSTLFTRRSLGALAVAAAALGASRPCMRSSA
jgi:hypothetical protein